MSYYRHADHSSLPGVFRELVSWDPFSHWRFRLHHPISEGGFAPHVDVKETDQEFKLFCELPGVKPEQVKLDLVDGVLELTGKKEEKKEEKDGERVVRNERQYGEFRRRFPLPSGTKAEHISAKFSHGVLEVTIVKAIVPANGRAPIPISADSLDKEAFRAKL